MKNTIVLVFAFVATAALAAPSVPAKAVSAPAKPTGNKAASNKNCEIQTTADNFVADLNGKTGEFVGNVIITQCETKLHADKVRITTTADNQADKVNAIGNVVVDDPKSGIATGQTGIYDVPHKMVTLNGNVVLKKNKNVMMGQQLTINLATGQASLGGGVKTSVPGQRGERVKATFTPNSQQ